MYDEILVPVDLDIKTNALAVEKALTLADQFGSRVHALHVVYECDDVNQPSDRDREPTPFDELRDVITEHGFDGEVEYTVSVGAPGPEILEYANDVGADLIVMPTHGRTGVQRLAIGSVTDVVIRNANCPVLAMNHDIE